MKKLLVILFVLVLIFSCKTMQNVQKKSSQTEQTIIIAEFPEHLQGQYFGTKGYLENIYIEIMQDCIIYKKINDSNFELIIQNLIIYKDTKNIVYYYTENYDSVAFEFIITENEERYINYYFNNILVDVLIPSKKA